MRFLHLFFASLTAFSALLGSAAPAQAKDGPRVVPTDQVCMVNDQFFGRKQIPVEHAGKTYYGCCENCKKTLTQEAGARQAKDALTGRTIDKASAVIAAREDGSVLYFADKANFEKFKKQSMGRPGGGL